MLITKGGRKQRLWIGICIGKKIFVVVGKNGRPGSAVGVIDLTFWQWRWGRGRGRGWALYIFIESPAFWEENACQQSATAA
jgi:hypothetical protein